MYSLYSKKEEVKTQEINNLIKTISSSNLNKCTLSHNYTGEHTTTIIDNPEDLLRISNALHNIDSKGISGHSGSVKKGDIVFHFHNKNILKFRISIHKYDLEHAFLSSNEFAKKNKGVRSYMRLKNQGSLFTELFN